MKIKGKALIIPDCHIPYHDKRAYDLMLKVARAQKITEVVILGDYADFYAINSHGKSPAINQLLKKEIDAVISELKRLRRLFPKAKIVYIQGNHEYRLERYIERQCPELYDVIDCKSILKLDALQIKFIPYGPNQIYSVLGSKLKARHEPLAGGKYAAHASVVKAGCSLIFGHLHTIAESQVVMMDGSNHRGITCGWLGDKDHPVMSYVKNHHQWAQGFSLVTALTGGTFFNETKHIIGYKTCHNGKVYSN